MEIPHWLVLIRLLLRDSNSSLVSLNPLPQGIDQPGTKNSNSSLAGLVEGLRRSEISTLHSPIPHLTVPSELRGVASLLTAIFQILIDQFQPDPVPRR